MPNLFIIAGCAGAGKTTVANTLLPGLLNCKEFVDADNLTASGVMLNRFEFFMDAREDFAIETTLATETHAVLIKKAQSIGYKVSLIFMWLNTPELAIKRVASRVSMGGYSIPDDVIKSDFELGRYNLHSIYMPICDFYTVITTDMGKPDQVKTREAGQVTQAVDSSGLLVNTQAKLSPENVVLRDKILKGAIEAYKKLLTANIESNRKLVIADEDGQIHLVPAAELIKKLSEN